MKKISADILFGIGTRLAIRLRGLLFIPLISIYMGVAAFGAYSQTLAIVTLLELFFTLGLHESLVRYGQQRDDLADLYFSLLAVVVLISGTAAGGFYAMSDLLARVTLGSTAYAEAFEFGAIMVATRPVIRLARNYYRIDSRIKLFSIIQAIKVYSFVAVVTVAVVFFDSGLGGVLGLMALVEIALAALLQIHIVSEIGVAVPSFEGLRRHLRFSIPITLSTMAGMASSRVDRIIIGYFLGATAVGLYSMAYQISIAILIYVNPIRETFFPEFSSLFDAGDLDACGRYLREGIRWFLLIALPSAGGMYLIGSDVIAILTAGAGIPGAALMFLLALGMAANGIGKIYGVILKAAEETDRRAIYTGIGAVANVLLNLLVVPVFGIAGAATATLLTYLLMGGLLARRARVLVPTRFPLGSFLRATGATGAMVLIGLTVDIDHLLITIATSVVVYTGLLFLTRELTVEECRAAL